MFNSGRQASLSLLGAPVSQGLDYVQAQVLKAYLAAGSAGDSVGKARALARIAKWRMVQHGIGVGSLRVGSRTPLDGVPPWATLEVLHGGFASGTLLAEVPLSPDEHGLAQSLGASGNGHRSTLNLHYLSPQGREELLAALDAGELAIDLPEHGALLVVAWLFERGLREQAFLVVDEIAPFFDRLRFWPSFRRSTPQQELLQLRSSEALVEQLSNKQTPRQIAILISRYETWNELYDRLAGLICSSREQGVYLRSTPREFFHSLAELLGDIDAARSADPLGEPSKKSNFQRLLSMMPRLHREGELSAKGQAHVARCMEGYLSKYGEPTGAKLGALREQQRAFLSKPRLVELCQVVVSRLKDDVSAGFEYLVRPIQEPGHPRMGAPVEMPKALHAKVLSNRPGSLEQLLDWGVVSSNEVMAALVPTLSARALAQSAADERARSLLDLSYRAFSARRSLLLVGLATQVSLDELPWIAALRSADVHTLATARAARSVTDRVVGLSLIHFPEQPLSNPFLRELQLLRKQAGQEPRLVQELAADIFQGHFTRHFEEMAQRSCAGLRGSIYDAYYDLPSKAELSQSFAILCRNRAGGQWSLGCLTQRTVHRAIADSNQPQPLGALPGWRAERDANAGAGVHGSALLRSRAEAYLWCGAQCAYCFGA